VQQQIAGFVVAPDVVLHIQRALGRARQQTAGRKGFLRVFQRVKTRVRGIGLRLLAQLLVGLAQGGLLRRWQRDGLAVGFGVCHRWKAAGGQQHSQGGAPQRVVITELAKR